MKNRKIKLIAIAIAMLTLCTVFCVAFTGCGEKTQKKEIELNCYLAIEGLDDFILLPEVTSHITYQYNFSKDRVEVNEVDIAMDLGGQTSVYDKKWGTSYLDAGQKINYSKENIALCFDGDEMTETQKYYLGVAIDLALFAASTTDPVVGAFITSMDISGVTDMIKEEIYDLISRYGNTDAYANILFWDNHDIEGVEGDAVWMTIEFDGFGLLFTGIA